MNEALVGAIATLGAAFLMSQSGWLQRKVNGHHDRIVGGLLLVGIVLFGIGVWRVETEIRNRQTDDCTQVRQNYTAIAGLAELIGLPLEVPQATGDLAAAIAERNMLFATTAARIVDRLGPMPNC